MQYSGLEEFLNSFSYDNQQPEVEHKWEQYSPMPAPVDMFVGLKAISDEIKEEEDDEDSLSQSDDRKWRWDESKYKLTHREWQ